MTVWRPLDLVIFATPLLRNLRNRGSKRAVFLFCSMYFPDVVSERRLFVCFYYLVDPPGLHSGGIWPSFSPTVVS